MAGARRGRTVMDRISLTRTKVLQKVSSFVSDLEIIIMIIIMHGKIFVVVNRKYKGACLFLSGIKEF